MRHIIAFEGRTTVPTQFLEHGSLKWDDKPLVVTWMADYSDVKNIIGTATDIQRDEAGVVTAEIEWNDPEQMKQLEKDVAVTVWCNELDLTREDRGNYDDIIVHSAKIKMLYATPSVPWVGMEVGEDLTEHMRKRRF